MLVRNFFVVMRPSPPPDNLRTAAGRAARDDRRIVAASNRIARLAFQPAAYSEVLGCNALRLSNDEASAVGRQSIEMLALVAPMSRTSDHRNSCSLVPAEIRDGSSLLLVGEEVVVWRSVHLRWL